MGCAGLLAINCRVASYGCAGLLAVGCAGLLSNFRLHSKGN